jgi:hypothetical protein
MSSLPWNHAQQAFLNEIYGISILESEGNNKTDASKLNALKDWFRSRGETGHTFFKPTFESDDNRVRQGKYRAGMSTHIEALEEEVLRRVGLYAPKSW